MLRIPFFIRISLSSVDCTNAAYHASYPRSVAALHQALASGSRILWSDRLFRFNHPKTLGQPVCRTANALTAAIQNVRVNHGRTNVAVPQKFLNGSNDIAIGEQMGSKRMPRGFSSGRLHSFRHFFCSQMANANTPIMALQQWLGHRNSAMVMHYYHLNSADAKKLMSSIRLLPRSEQIPGNG